MHMMFPYSGGPIYGGTVVGKHRQTPYVSMDKMDLNLASKGFLKTPPMKIVIG